MIENKGFSEALFFSLAEECGKSEGKEKDLTQRAQREEALRRLRRGELMREDSTAIDVFKAISSERGKMGRERGLPFLWPIPEPRASEWLQCVSSEVVS